MQALAIFKNGEITNDQAKNLLLNVQDGHYIIERIPMYPKSSQESRELFFYKLGRLSDHLGYTKDEAYNQFKKDKEIGSLAGHSTIEEWFIINQRLKEWAWEKLEIII